MSPSTARLLRKYALLILPEVAARKFPRMQGDLYRFLKRRYERANHIDKASLRHIAKQGLPLPNDIKQEARQLGIIVSWPPEEG